MFGKSPFSPGPPQAQCRPGQATPVGQRVAALRPALANEEKAVWLACGREREGDCGRTAQTVEAGGLRAERCRRERERERERERTRDSGCGVSEQQRRRQWQSGGGGDKASERGSSLLCSSLSLSLFDYTAKVMRSG